MKQSIFSPLAISLAILLSPSFAQAATVMYDAAEDYEGNAPIDIQSYGTAGYEFAAVVPVNNSAAPAGATYNNVDPLTFTSATYNALVSAPIGVTFTAPNLTVQAQDSSYGTLPDGGFDYIGEQGVEGSDASVPTSQKVLTLTFGSGSLLSYEVTVFTEGQHIFADPNATPPITMDSGGNNNSANGVTVDTTGLLPSTATNTPTGAGFDVVGYSFDITGVQVGDTASITLSLPQYQNLNYFGIGIDALSALPALPAAPEPSTYALFLLAGVALVVIHRRRSSTVL